MSDKPNFLFFITDQHRADYLGCSGHPVLKTPNIDSIAARGRRFDRFYVANPVCMPNRSTLMTGRMPSVHGVRHNGIPLSMRANTFTELLRDAGWRTALVGKSHLQNMTPFGPIMERPAINPNYAPPGEGHDEATLPIPGDGPYDQEDPKRWANGEFAPMTLPFYGFDHVDLCTGHGDEVGGHYTHWLYQKHDDSESLRGAENQLPHDYVCPQAIRTSIPEEHYPTAYIQEKALEYLDQRAVDDQPFFAMVSFPDPHHPFTPPGKYWDMYKPEDMTLPPSFDHGNRPLPPHLAWAREQLEAGTAERGGQNTFAVNARETLEAMALTCGMIAMVDDAIGAILAGLKAHGMDENTVIVFTSDHGDFLGDHQLMLKGPAHYHGLIRVPFIWADTPDRASPAGVTDELSGTLDIAGTILERAALQPYNGIQGRSLLTDTAGDSAQPDAMLIEADDQRNYLGFDKPPRLRTLVTRTHRMTIYQGVDWGEIYDLESDPNELDNLWDDPGSTGLRAELMEILARKQIELTDRSPFPTGRA
jgi:arylsulfatase A-like enzyme